MTQPTGQAKYQSPTSDYNAFRFAAMQILLRFRTAIPAEVLTCTSDGQIAPAGRVTIRPAVNAVDGAGNAVPHGSIFDVPYFRLQGGGNAVIIDPAQGDMGLAIFADRDISSWKSNGAVSNPGSARVYDMGDALYIGGFNNAASILQYVAFTPNGIVVSDMNGNQINMEAGKIAMTTPLLDVSGDIHSNGVPVGYTHTHPDPQGGNTGPPNP